MDNLRVVITPPSHLKTGESMSGVETKDRKIEIRIFLFFVGVDVFILSASLTLKCKPAVYNMPRK